MGFWDAYRASLKPIEVEEPIDYWLHRPLGYIVARLSYPTPLSPDLITVGSILLGWSAAACLFADFPGHLVVGGALILASTVFDCADGQLARMRKTSSVFGRQLDGSADLLVVLSLVPATIYRMWSKHHDPPWLGGTLVVLAILTTITSSWHTAAYDYYKNLWCRFTTDNYQEGESVEQARARFAAQRGQMTTVQRLTYWLYLYHVTSQRDIVRMLDPYTSIEKIPTRTPETEAIFRRHQTRPWALCRSLFGVGSLMFGLAVFNALDLADVYLLVRLVVLNGIYFGPLRSWQRKASRELSAELGARAA